MAAHGSDEPPDPVKDKPNPRYSPPINDKGDRVIYDDKGGPVSPLDRVTLARQQLARSVADERVLSWLEGCAPVMDKLDADERALLARFVMDIVGRSVANDRAHRLAFDKERNWRLSCVDCVPDPREDRIGPHGSEASQIRAAPEGPFEVISRGKWGTLVRRHDQAGTLDVIKPGEQP